MVTVPIDNVDNDEVDLFFPVNPHSCVFDTSDDDASCDGSPSPSNDRMSAEELAKAVAEHKTQLENMQPLADKDKEFTKLHYKLNHLPYKQMQVLADRGGILPAKFDSKKYTPHPCAFGKQKRSLPWRRSKKQCKPLKKATKLGERVHVDHMVSRQPGLIPQVVGFLTNRRYAGALVFVEELSYFTYVHLVEGRDSSGQACLLRTTCKVTELQFKPIMEAMEFSQIKHLCLTTGTMINSSR